MKIRKEKHLAILGEDYTYDLYGKHTVKKGTTFDMRGMYKHNGALIVLGHGANEVVPRALFTKFIKTWEEVEETVVNGTKVLKITPRETDVTKDTLEFWKTLDEKKEKVEKAVLRRALRYDIAEVRRILKDVKNGNVENELKNLLAKLKAAK